MTYTCTRHVYVHVREAAKAHVPRQHPEVEDHLGVGGLQGVVTHQV